MALRQFRARCDRSNRGQPTFTVGWSWGRAPHHRPKPRHLYLTPTARLADVAICGVKKLHLSPLALYRSDDSKLRSER
jgi:hypothetical protein